MFGNEEPCCTFKKIHNETFIIETYISPSIISKRAGLEMKTCLCLIWWAERSAFPSCRGEGSGIYLFTSENRQVNFGASSGLKILQPLIGKQPQITRPCFPLHQGLHCLLPFMAGALPWAPLPSCAASARGGYFLFYLFISPILFLISVSLWFPGVILTKPHILFLSFIALEGTAEHMKFVSNFTSAKKHSWVTNTCQKNW